MTRPQFPDPLGLREALQPGATAHRLSGTIEQRLAALEQAALARPPAGTPNGSGMFSDTAQPGGVGWRSPIQRMKVGSFSVAGTTGNKAVTGVGFKPALVVFAITWTNLAEVLSGEGAMDSSGGQWCTFGHINGANAKYSGSSSNDCFALVNAAAGNAVLIAAQYVSMDTDGFTYNLSTANSSGRVKWIAYA